MAFFFVACPRLLFCHALQCIFGVNINGVCPVQVALVKSTFPTRRIEPPGPFQLNVAPTPDQPHYYVHMLLGGEDKLNIQEVCAENVHEPAIATEAPAAVDTVPGVVMAETINVRTNSK